MDPTLFGTLGKFAGLGGLSLGIFLLLFREFIRKRIFRSLSRQQTYSLMRLFLVLTFSLATIGIAAWIAAPNLNNEKRLLMSSIPAEEFKRVYYEGFDVADLSKEQKRFEGIWQIGKRGDWSGTLQGGYYRLNNFGNVRTASFANTLDYFDDNDRQIDLGESKVTVRVRLNPPFSSYSCAGIKYRSSPDRKEFYAFVLNAGGSVSLMHKTHESMRILWSGEIDKKNAEFVSLKVIGRGKEIDLFVEDKLVHAEKTDSSVSGSPGAFAYSTGVFDFDDFNVFISTQR